jgi:hypothetical protein
VRQAPPTKRWRFRVPGQPDRFVYASTDDDAGYMFQASPYAPPYVGHGPVYIDEVPLADTDVTVFDGRAAPGA